MLVRESTVVVLNQPSTKSQVFYALCKYMHVGSIEECQVKLAEMSKHLHAGRGSFLRLFVTSARAKRKYLSV